MRMKITIMRSLFIAMWALVQFAIPSCQLRDEGPVNKTPAGVAIKGYDPVAYFLDRMPVQGSDDFTYSWNGALWKFSSARHRELFAGNPERYAPRYGGYCAFAVSIGRTADIDPNSWSIVNEKLYLNLDKKTQRLWEQDMPGNIRKADENWIRMRGRGSS